MNTLCKPLALAAGLATLVTCGATADSFRLEDITPGQANSDLHMQHGADQTQAKEITPGIYKAIGFGNTFMVVTDEGNVIIDTSLAQMAPRHKELLTAVDDGPINTIILTHGHPDHTGGVPLWRQPDTRVIGQENMVEFLHYEKRLSGFFQRRNAAQFGLEFSEEQVGDDDSVQNYAADILPDTLFDDEMTIEVGGQRFDILHTPGETYDALTVWMPQKRAAFIGDLFYPSFPNMYTLRGTKPRWALDYVNSLDRVLALKPAILLPSHGEPILGEKTIRETLVRYRDAIQYVHDQTVLGLNQGKDVYSLMREIRLPASLDMGEGYGSVSWSVRGIYEGYVGWFDGNPVNMYAQPPSAVYPELVALAGGPEGIVARAGELLASGEPVAALRLLDVALAAAPAHRSALKLKRDALMHLRQRSVNFNESGWLDAGIHAVDASLEAAH